jgi:hypothetical protein
MAAWRHGGAAAWRRGGVAGRLVASMLGCPPATSSLPATIYRHMNAASRQPQFTRSTTAGTLADGCSGQESYLAARRKSKGIEEADAGAASQAPAPRRVVAHLARQQVDARVEHVDTCRKQQHVRCALLAGCAACLRCLPRLPCIPRPAIRQASTHPMRTQ